MDVFPPGSSGQGASWGGFFRETSVDGRWRFWLFNSNSYFSYETPVEILVQTLLFKISKTGRLRICSLRFFLIGSQGPLLRMLILRVSTFLSHIISIISQHISSWTKVTHSGKLGQLSWQPYAALNLNIHRSQDSPNIQKKWSPSLQFSAIRFPQWWSDVAGMQVAPLGSSHLEISMISGSTGHWPWLTRHEAPHQRCVEDFRWPGQIRRPTWQRQKGYVVAGDKPSG